MSNSGSLTNRVLAIALLAWALVLVAGYYAIQWVPYEPLSAAGDLTYITPAIASVTAVLASLLSLASAGPKLGKVSLAGRLLVVLPVVLSFLTGAVVYIRA